MNPKPIINASRNGTHDVEELHDLLKEGRLDVHQGGEALLYACRHNYVECLTYVAVFQRLPLTSVSRSKPTSAFHTRLFYTPGVALDVIWAK